jgi:hypothetical protein
MIAEYAVMARPDRHGFLLVEKTIIFNLMTEYVALKFGVE